MVVSGGFKGEIIWSGEELGETGGKPFPGLRIWLKVTLLQSIWEPQELASFGENKLFKSDSPD
jgi:hypothetical protein